MTELDLDRERFLRTLAELVHLGPHLVNSVDTGRVPREGLAADVVQRALASAVSRGLMSVDRVAAPGYEERPNLVLTLPGSGHGQVAFVGSHFDVVPADWEREGWSRDPFTLTEEGGVLYGRGTTDCLGHVALLTELLRSLAERGTPPQQTVIVVLIANEESSPVTGVGLDYLATVGRLDPLAAGPVYWLDAADFGPTIGTGGVARWRLEVTGIPGHSGMPHQCVNALELGMAFVLSLGRWFAREFPAHADEARYGYLSPSSFKATVIDAPNRGVSTIPGRVVVEGDLRATPFYSMPELTSSIAAHANALGRQLTQGAPPPEYPAACTREGLPARLDFSWIGEATEGVACRLDSPALAALERAIRRRRGPNGVARTSMTAALPLVRALVERGMDVQITGFGCGRYYHAPNEQALLGDFADGFAILRDLVSGV
ncbi:MAG: M20/M25/M40 family metallo-hydrolase [Polyangiaceae bacterium]|nr:M20/M25/M40 family metallo-hydrolase [Polyangiaceae bacterium]